MANCIDCVHFEVCQYDEQERAEANLEPSYRDLSKYIADGCKFFKNKADFVELPFVAMVEQFIKDGKSDKKRVAHNGRFAVVYIDKSKWNCPLIDITEQFYNDEKAKERIQALKEGADNG